VAPGARLGSFPPPLLSTQPIPVRIFLAGVLPCAFGLACGALIRVSPVLFLGLQAIAIAAGFLAGMEHDRTLAGTARGILGGLLFGLSILTGHALAGGDDGGVLPDPHALQLAFTVIPGAILGTLGARYRDRRVSRAP
jgi:hypothetical protein